MLRNFITCAIRSLWKNKGISILNLAGLALGLTSFLFVALYVIDELRYDRYHAHHDRIFRVDTELRYNDAVTSFAVAAPPLGEALAANFPEVEDAARVMPLRNVRFKKDGQILREDRVFYADSNLFRIFTLPAIHGDPVSALATPYSIVITESTARRYFNTADAVGMEILQVDDTTLRVVGAVIRDMPPQSHFHADFFLSLRSNASARSTNFNQFTFHTYLLLRPGADEKALESKFAPFLRKHLSSNMDMDKFEKRGNYIRIGLTALNDIHLHSNIQRELEANGDIRIVYIFSAVALLILLLACINFMNLSTARSANRAREVGVRKVLGSVRKTLVAQFLMESTLVTVLAMVVACILAWLLLPLVNEISGKTIAIAVEDVGWLAPLLVALALAIGLLAGFYPAFFLSRFQPVEVLKGKLSAGFKGRRLRALLVVFQFSTSTFLIVGTLVIYHQLSYILNTDVGFDREQVFTVRYVSVLEDPVTLKEEVKALPGVRHASLSGYLPTGGSRWSTNISVPGKEGLMSECWLVDVDYVPTMGMKMLAGRSFSERLSTDSAAVIINETAAKMLGFSNAPWGEVIHVGIGHGSRDYHVIGIVEDFNFNSLRENITPLVMVLGYDWSASLSVRVEAGRLSSVLGQVESKWHELMPDQKIDYTFMDEDFEAMYRAELRLENLFMIFAVVAIAIACLGLFGLSAYAAEQRSREMSIRKILGATMGNLMRTLSLDFITPVIIAILITMPLAWLAVEAWLQTFAYRESISGWTFIAAGLTTVAIAVMTIIFQCAKAARVNPAESLRSE